MYRILSLILTLYSIFSLSSDRSYIPNRAHQDSNKLHQKMLPIFFRSLLVSTKCGLVIYLFSCGVCVPSVVQNLYATVQKASRPVFDLSVRKKQNAKNTYTIGVATVKIRIKTLIASTQLQVSHVKL